MKQQANNNISNNNNSNQSDLGGLPRRRSNTIASNMAPPANGRNGATAAAYLHDPDQQQLIGAIDQGTSSTRFLVFERGSGQLVASSQLEMKRLTPCEGWVEMDPNVIMSSVYATMADVRDQLLARQHHQSAMSAAGGGISGGAGDIHNQNGAPNGLPLTPPPAPAHQLSCIGICNQRESTVVWDAKTGQPLYNVIVWMDNRTKDLVDGMINSMPAGIEEKTGLPMSTYFSAFKLRWLLDNVSEVKQALDENRLLFGTVDTWILWNLTGNHLTDVTNASRTFLMDIHTLQWDKSLCNRFGVPIEILPKILSSADDFGLIQFGPFAGTPITGVIGDQSAALFGHNCLQMGQTKATFGTGCFIMQNIGHRPIAGAAQDGRKRGAMRETMRGLITTVGYKLRDQPACYALEGSIKIAGAALTWLRDNMQLITGYEECDQLINLTTNAADVIFVPALGGLYSPYWDPNATGLFIGLSQFSRREHLVRATFDSVAFQTNDILSLMHGVTNGLMIDGGLCKSDNFSQILADITGCDIMRPAMCENSALGAAMVAGVGAGIWSYDEMLVASSSLSAMLSATTTKQTSTATTPNGYYSPRLHLASSNHHNPSTAIAHNNPQAHFYPNEAAPTRRHLDVFQPYISLEHRNDLINKWHLAVSISMDWSKFTPKRFSRQLNSNGPDHRQQNCCCCPSQCKCHPSSQPDPGLIQENSRLL